MNKKFGFAYLPIILIIIILGAIGAGGFIYTKNQSQPTTPDNSFKTLPITTATDETKDWKTYTNEKYGFEFKYPEGWPIDERVDIGLAFPRDVTGEAYKDISVGSRLGWFFDWSTDNTKVIYFPSPEGLEGLKLGFSANNSEDRQTVDQILSTFEFTP